MRITAHPANIVLALALGAAPAMAQVPGIPVYNSGVPRGIGLYADVGFPNDDARGGTGLALTGRGGFGPLGATAIISSYNPDGPAGGDLSVGATGNYRIFGGPLVPLSVTLQAGVGYAKPDAGLLPTDDITQWRFPIGIGFALTVPNPALAIRPWLAPRVDILRRSGDGFSETDTEFGLSGGVELNTLGGLGIHAAYDLILGDGANPGVLGLGAHYNFRIPGL